MKNPLENSASYLSTLNLIPSPDDLNHAKGHYSENLAFCNQDATFKNPETKHAIVYAPLTQSVENGSNLPKRFSKKNSVSSCTIRKAVISGCLVAAAIIVLYLWFHIKLVNPLILEIFEIVPTTTETTKTSATAFKISTPVKSEWKVDYDLPTGIPVLRINADEMVEIKINIDCPLNKFALDLYVDSNLELVENFLIACGKNVAYFRVDGSLSLSDTDKLKANVPNAEKLELKASLKLEKGENILDIPEFIETKDADVRIKTVEISGFVTFDTLDELIEVVPLAEELTIKGGEICKSLQRPLKSSREACQTTWPILQKLSFVETQECRTMYDLIYSCWNMPNIETLQIRRCIISGPNAGYITGVLDKNRIMKVDFADNVCFDDTLQTVPFMCQDSP